MKIEANPRNACPNPTIRSIHDESSLSNLYSPSIVFVIPNFAHSQTNLPNFAITSRAPATFCWFSSLDNHFKMGRTTNNLNIPPSSFNKPPRKVPPVFTNPFAIEPSIPPAPFFVVPYLGSILGLSLFASSRRSNDTCLRSATIAFMPLIVAPKLLIATVVLLRPLAVS